MALALGIQIEPVPRRDSCRPEAMRARRNSVHFGIAGGPLDYEGIVRKHNPAEIAYQARRGDRLQ